MKAWRGRCTSGSQISTLGHDLTNQDMIIDGIVISRSRIKDESPTTLTQQCHCLRSLQLKPELPQGQQNFTKWQNSISRSIEVSEDTRHLPLVCWHARAKFGSDCSRQLARAPQ